MRKIIAHIDANCFYASVEMMRNPRLRDIPFAVCGSTEKRHGIVLTANYPAKRLGVKTGMANWQARETCPGLAVVHPHMDYYIQYSGFLRELYSHYSDRAEPFGLDECFVDLTGCVPSFEAGITAIQEIRERVRRELGITVSIGLSDNKVFAKLGSDMKKPDNYTVIPRGQFKEIVWPLPVSDLLYVGPRTTKKLALLGVRTIGGLAKLDEKIVQKWFGKVGLVLRAFANGEDQSKVAPEDFTAPIKSVGNSCTCPRDLNTDEDVKIMITLLSESVGARLMELGLCATGIEFSFSNHDFTGYGSRQCRIPYPTCLSKEISDKAFELFKQAYGGWPAPLRKVGVRACALVTMDAPRQLSLDVNGDKLAKLENLEKTINRLRERYGNKVVQRAVMLTDPVLSRIDAKKDNIVHPVGVFNGGVSVSWGGYSTTILA